MISIQTISLWNDPANPGDVQRLSYKSGIDQYQDTAYILEGSNSRSWIINLHGHGSLGSQLFVRDDVREHWLSLFSERGLSVLTADLRGNAWMCPAAAADLHDLIGWLRSEHEAERFVFVSGSMGGSSSLIYAALHPDDVHAVAAFCPATDLSRFHSWLKTDDRPICTEIRTAIEQAYGGTPKSLPKLFSEHSACEQHIKLNGRTILIVHGTDDSLIPIIESRALAERMADAPGFQYLEIHCGTHDSVLTQPCLDSFLGQLEL